MTFRKAQITPCPADILNWLLFMNGNTEFTTCSCSDFQRSGSVVQPVGELFIVVRGPTGEAGADRVCVCVCVCVCVFSEAEAMRWECFHGKMIR